MAWKIESCNVNGYHYKIWTYYNKKEIDFRYVEKLNDCLDLMDYYSNKYSK